MNEPAASLLPVIFRGTKLFVIDVNGEPYVPMRPIVEGMGLSWAAQTVKINSNRERWGVSIIETPSSGGEQRAVCMPLRKLLGWLMTIYPNKVRADLRERIVQYQNECDDVLWRYWQQRAGGAMRALPEPPAEASRPRFEVVDVFDVPVGAGVRAGLVVRMRPAGETGNHVHVLLAPERDAAFVSYFVACELFEVLGLPYPLAALRDAGFGKRLDIHQTMAVAVGLNLAVLDRTLRTDRVWLESLRAGLVLLQAAELRELLALHSEELAYLEQLAATASRFIAEGFTTRRRAVMTIRCERLRRRVPRTEAADSSGQSSRQSETLARIVAMREVRARREANRKSQDAQH